MQSFVGQSSGRVCLLGDNADLIDEPAIAAAISAQTRCSLSVRNDRRIVLHGNDIERDESGSLDDLPAFETPLRYVWAVIGRLRDEIPSGFEMSIRSDVPIGAGMSSSTALCLAAIRTLHGAIGTDRSPADCAELAYQIESHDLRTECGRMDQYAIAFGGVTWIETGENASAERLPVQPVPIVVADTQEQHDTAELQVWLRRRIRERDTELLDSLGRVVSYVREGRSALLRSDHSRLGELMSLQQVEEKLMGTSTDRLEQLCAAARGAGALGAKQMGAGGGGCMIALAEPEQIDAVEAALSSSGAPTWRFTIGVED